MRLAVQFLQADELFNRVRITVLRELLVRERVRREQGLDNARLEAELYGIPGQVIGSVPLPLIEQGLRLFQSLLGQFLKLGLVTISLLNSMLSLRRLASPS